MNFELTVCRSTEQISVTNSQPLYCVCVSFEYTFHDQAAFGFTKDDYFSGVGANREMVDQVLLKANPTIEWRWVSIDWNSVNCFINDSLLASCNQAMFTLH